MNNQEEKLTLRDLEERVERIENWIDFWETIPTPWEVKKDNNPITKEVCCEKCDAKMEYEDQINNEPPTKGEIHTCKNHFCPCHPKVEEVTNQCDGCLRNLPIKYGFHYAYGRADSSCTKDRYTSKAKKIKKAKYTVFHEQCKYDACAGCLVKMSVNEAFDLFFKNKLPKL